MDPNRGVKCRIPRAPWLLFFDGASRKPAQYAALGFVLKNSKGKVVQEGRRVLGGGISSELAKFKALIAGLRKAQSLQVKHLLVKGNSRLMVNQVVGRCAVKDASLRNQLKKAWVIAKEFDSLFVEFIPKNQNTHADRIANAAIDKELQIQQVVTEYFDRSGAWPISPIDKSAPVSPVPARAQIPFSSPKLRSISPQHQKQNLNTNNVTNDSEGSKPISSALKTTPSRRGTVEVQVSKTKEPRASNPELHTSSIKSFKVSDCFWHKDLHRLSTSDESSITESDEESYFKLFKASCLPEISAHAAATTTSNISMASDDDSHDTENVDVDSSENEEVFSSCSASSHRLRSTSAKPVINVSSAGVASGPSEIDLSESDYDHLVTAVISRLKKTRLADD